MFPVIFKIHLLTHTKCSIQVSSHRTAVYITSTVQAKCCHQRRWHSVKDVWRMTRSRTMHFSLLSGWGCTTLPWEVIFVLAGTWHVCAPLSYCGFHHALSLLSTPCERGRAPIKIKQSTVFLSLPRFNTLPSHVLTTLDLIRSMARDRVLSHGRDDLWYMASLHWECTQRLGELISAWYTCFFSVAKLYYLVRHISIPTMATLPPIPPHIARMWVVPLSPKSFLWYSDQSS